VTLEDKLVEIRKEVKDLLAENIDVQDEDWWKALDIARRGVETAQKSLMKTEVPVQKKRND
jgi:hypothetical protein